MYNKVLINIALEIDENNNNLIIFFSLFLLMTFFKKVSLLIQIIEYLRFNNNTIPL